MKGRISRTLVWLRRIGHCRGFGVQSPWAYSFVRYVISEHYPYYAYARLRRKHPGVSIDSRRKGEFILRLANFAQPLAVVCVGLSGQSAALLKSYSWAGCRKRVFLQFPSVGEYLQWSASRQAAAAPVILCAEASADGIDDMFATLHSGDFLFLNAISASPRAKTAWRKVAEELPGVVSFDMYYCGVAYFDDKRYKQNYIINF